jgi:hypothetical protein
MYTVTTEISRFWARVFRRFDGSARVEQLGEGAYRISIEDGGGMDFNDIVIVVRSQQPEVALSCNNVVAKTPQLTIERGDTLTCEVRPLVAGRGPVWATA